MLVDLRDSDLVVHIYAWYVVLNSYFRSQTDSVFFIIREFDKGEKTMKIVMEHGHCGKSFGITWESLEIFDVQYAFYEPLDLQHTIKSKYMTCLKLRGIWERLLTIVDVIHKRGKCYSLFYNSC